MKEEEVKKDLYIFLNNLSSNIELGLSVPQAVDKIHSDYPFLFTKKLAAILENFKMGNKIEHELLLFFNAFQNKKITILASKLYFRIPNGEELVEFIKKEAQFLITK